MGKVTDFKKASLQTNLAGEVQPKLEEARSRLAELESQASAAALAAALNELGASKQLAEINRQLDDARRDVAQLEGALRLAEQRDTMAQAQLDARARREQLAAMQRHARARLDAVTELCTAIETAAKSYTRFLAATDEMALALPLGMISHPISWHMVGIMLDGREFPARIEAVIAGEMFRHADLTRADGRIALPGASPPTEKQRLAPSSIEPATDAVRRMNEWLIGMVDEKLKSIEQKDAARFAKTA